MSYLHWAEIKLTDYSEHHIAKRYADGFVFTRIEKGVMLQTRSLRIDLSAFVLSSENKRVLKKTEGLQLSVYPLPYAQYHWSIAKTAKDFYDKKFATALFSANKIKELLTDSEKSNFNALLMYSSLTSHQQLSTLGYCIAFEHPTFMHYSYPFYDLETSPKDMGLGMMIRAILYAKEQGKAFFYLGSAQRPNDTYKLQFKGMEWFDGTTWSHDLSKLKGLLV